MTVATDANEGPNLPDHMTLGDARQWLRDRRLEGAKCPCCTQFAKVYKRTITSSMAWALVKMYRAGAADDFVDVPTVLGRGPGRAGDDAKLVYWGLTLEAHEKRPDGGRAGWWRLTPDGVRFILGTLYVPKYAHVYDGRLVSPKFSGPLIGIRDALGKRFDLRELMGWSDDEGWA